MGDLPKAGAVDLTSIAYSTSCQGSNPSGIRTENWVTADKTIGDIIRQVEPTSVSEERRRKVVDFIQRLIKNRLGAEVFPYGSVPLKTYLPDGDIDLTAFGGANFEDTLVDDIKSVLEEQEKNTASEFVVKDLQIIRAEVKIVKCIVQDIVVDVSFNQIGGLCTLCFLEQVDRLIGKDHLFKRSIILIKAWCYYESRILGAHHGLISTYALETLVLYIFNLYHSMLDGPLAVLYKFLDHFSKFDWDTYCVSLQGPVLLSSLPDIVAEMPEDSDRDLLLSYEFLNYCVGKFSVPSTGGDRLLRGFQRKHLNIVDPLKEINNLGRSVSKGNFYRIRSAFSYGARKLAQILSQSNYVADELHKFFANTLARHGGAQTLLDSQDLEPSSICKKPIPGVHLPETVLSKTDSPDKFDQLVDSTRDLKSMSRKMTQDLSRVKESTSSDMTSRFHWSISESKHQMLLDRDQTSVTNSLGPSFCEDSNGSAALSTFEDLKISPDSSIHQTPLAPHLYFSNSRRHDGSKMDINQDSEKQEKYEKNAASSDSFGTDGRRVSVGVSMVEKQLVDEETVPSSKSNDVFSAPNSSFLSGESSHVDVVQKSAHRSETTEHLSSLDLTGDYDGYLRCLQYGRRCLEQGLSMQYLHVPSLPSTVYQNNNLWDGFLPPLTNFNQNGFTHRHLNGFHPNPTLYALQPVVLQGVRFGWDDAPKPRGTGTYIPNMNQTSNGYRPAAPLKGKNHAPLKSPCDNGQIMSFPDTVDRSSHDLAQPEDPVENSSVASSCDGYVSLSPRGYKLADNANGSSIQPEAVVEFEEVGSSSGVSVPEIGRQGGLVCSSPIAILGMQLPQAPLSRKQDRILLASSYRLKDEDDFPPLSVQDGATRLSVT